MKSQLVVSVLSTDRVGIVSDLCQAAYETGCSIETSRMTTLGAEFAVILLLSGKWDALAKFENHIISLEQQGLVIQARRTQRPPATANSLRYDVSAISMDQPGLIYSLSSFFAERGILIEDLISNDYTANYSGTPMLCLEMTVSVDYQIKIAELREQFMLLCEELNIDAVLEPAKI